MLSDLVLYSLKSRRPEEGSVRVVPVGGEDKDDRKIRPGTNSWSGRPVGELRKLGKYRSGGDSPDRAKD